MFCTIAKQKENEARVASQERQHFGINPRIATYNHTA